MSARTFALVAGTVLTIAGCSIGKPLPRVTTYIVEPSPPPASARARRAETLRMGQVRVASAFAGRGLVYRMDDVKYVADPYEAFIAEPAGMLGQQMAAWLDRAGPFSAVAQPGSARTVKSAPFTLEAMVTELYGDFRVGPRPAAVVSIQFALMDLEEARQTVVYERTISRRVEIAQASQDALVRGYDAALTEILIELSSGLATARRAE